MNLTDLQERLAKLQNEQQSLQQQITANIGAYSGAIQECQYWIGVVSAESVPEPATEPVAEPVAEDNVSFQ